MNRHTPGPWILATSNSWRRIESSTGESVCCPVTQKDGHPDLHFQNGGLDGPDARLIVASPRLLEALKAMLVIAEASDDFHDGAEGTDARRDAEVLVNELGGGR